MVEVCKILKAGKGRKTLLQRQKQTFDYKVSKSFDCPALHVFLGIVNKLCDDLELRRLEFHVWPTKLGVQKKNITEKYMV